MATEIAYCIDGHAIDGVIPAIMDEKKFEVQNAGLIGRTCDCKKLIYSEGKCQTCSGEKWRVIWKENNNQQ